MVYFYGNGKDLNLCGNVCDWRCNALDQYGDNALNRRGDMVERVIHNTSDQCGDLCDQCDNV